MAIENNASKTLKNIEKERKAKMAEEKTKQKEEMKLLKEREDEQKRLLEEAKEKRRYRFAILPNIYSICCSYLVYSC